MNPRFPPQFPPVWAVAWGDDRFGLWAEFAVDEVVQRMRWIEAGEFLMGSPDKELQRFEREGPQHRVRISEGFWLADSVCTQALWMAMMVGMNPSRFSADLQNPVEQVSWDYVKGFLFRLQRLLPEGGEACLPSEAQWEYACRAGTQTAFNLGNSVTTDQVNYHGNFPYADAAKGEYRQRTVSVKSLPPNRWGLYEMHGNVWEWCADDLRDYSAAPASEVLVDPTGPTESASRAVRGGAWIGDAQCARSAYRFAAGRDRRGDARFGFRLALRS